MNVKSSNNYDEQEGVYEQLEQVYIKMNTIFKDKAQSMLTFLKEYKLYRANRQKLLISLVENLSKIHMHTYTLYVCYQNLKKYRELKLQRARIREKKLATRIKTKFFQNEGKRLVTTSSWYIHYVLMSDQWKKVLMDENSKEGKLFKLRFRLPFTLYVHLLQRVRDAEKDKQSTLLRKQFNIYSKEVYPVDLMLLGSLRYLGRTCIFDCISELTNICLLNLRRWFNTFVSWYSNIFCKMPKTTDEIYEVAQSFYLNGLPGFIGSIDGTDIRCIRPFSQKVLNTSVKNKSTKVVNISAICALNG